MRAQNWLAMRLYVDFDDAEYDEIQGLANRERRDPRDQVAVLAMRALREQLAADNLEPVRKRAEQYAQEQNQKMKN